MTIPVPFTGNQPTYAHEDDAGADLTTTQDTYIHPGNRALIPTSHAGLICPRSGLAHKHGISVRNAPGF